MRGRGDGRLLLVRHKVLARGAERADGEDCLEMQSQAGAIPHLSPPTHFPSLTPPLGPDPAWRRAGTTQGQDWERWQS